MSDQVLSKASNKIAQQFTADERDQMFCGTAEWISSLGDEVVVEIDLREVLGVGIEPFGCGGEHGSLSGGWRLSGVPQMPGNTSDQAKNRWRLRLVELLSGRVALEFATQLVKPPASRLHSLEPHLGSSLGIRTLRSATGFESPSIYVVILS